jgi:hypothetical protein
LTLGAGHDIIKNIDKGKELFRIGRCGFARRLPDEETYF